ncbi:MAG: DUF3784 domain-containing protein [Oscillospiraceae bacterium]
MLIELIVMTLIGLIFIYLGLMIWKKQKKSLIHSYHYTRVKEKDIKAYTEMMGKGVLLIGIGCVFTGVFDYITKSAGGWVGFGMAFFWGLSLIVKAQKKYNGSIF